MLLLTKVHSLFGCSQFLRQVLFLSQGPIQDTSFSLFRLLLAVTFSQTCLVFDDFDILRSIGQVFYRISSTGNCLMFFSLVFGKMTIEIRFYLYRIISRVHTINIMYYVDVDIDHPAVVAFVRFLHCKITRPNSQSAPHWTLQLGLQLRSRGLCVLSLG